MKIKTIKGTNSINFDKAVNVYLSGGWVLLKLEAVKGDKLTTLVAFLGREN